MGNLRGNSTDATAAGTNGVETPRTGTARSDDRMEEEESGGGEATRGVGQNQRSSAPRVLGAEAAEAAAGDMDDAEEPEAGTESVAGARSQPKPVDWEAMTRNQRKLWTKARRKQQRKDLGHKGGLIAQHPRGRCY